MSNDRISMISHGMESIDRMNMKTYGMESNDRMNMKTCGVESIDRMNMKTNGEHCDRRHRRLEGRKFIDKKSMNGSRVGEYPANVRLEDKPSSSTDNLSLEGKLLQKVKGNTGTIATK